jgi:hypothetical protein
MESQIKEKYLSHPPERTNTTSPNQESVILTPTNMLLLKLTFRPDIVSNNTRTARRVLIRVLLQLYRII